ncbi:hypothetical protein [Embleya sp. NPDC005971]|uniref:hypothetical protein n=1 Tax=Embleya sp. NPDC005971 TaxID=3156724 RepID=UPI0033E556A1
MGFAARVDDAGESYLMRVVAEIERLFRISREEALVRVDRHFRPYRWDFTREADSSFLTMHSPEYWARRICLGDDFDDPGKPDREDLSPVPVPEAGDPEFGGRAMGEGGFGIQWIVPLNVDLSAIASVVSGSPQTADGYVFGMVGENMEIKILATAGPAREGAWMILCMPNADASWQDVAVDVRRIAYRLEAAGVVDNSLNLVDFHGPTRLLTWSFYSSDSEPELPEPVQPGEKTSFRPTSDPIPYHIGHAGAVSVTHMVDLCGGDVAEAGGILGLSEEAVRESLAVGEPFRQVLYVVGAGEDNPGADIRAVDGSWLTEYRVRTWLADVGHTPDGAGMAVYVLPYTEADRIGEARPRLTVVGTAADVAAVRVAVADDGEVSEG